MLKIIRRPQVLIDLVELADYVAQDDPEVAERFIDAFDESLKRLAQFPNLGTVRDFPNTQFKQLRHNELIWRAPLTHPAG